MLSLTLREMRAHARRLTGTSLAVLLGVAFLAGTLVLGDTLRRNFDTLFTDVNAGTDVVVRNATDLSIDAPRGLIPLSLVDDVAAVDGVRPPSPSSAATASCSAPTAKPSAATARPSSAGAGSRTRT